MPDVTILGAGIFGLSVAWACQRRGARVAVIDPHGVAAGASGGVVGALAPHVPEGWTAVKEFQFRSLIMAEAFWAEVADAGGGDPGYGRLGRLQPVVDAAALARAGDRATRAATLWQGRAVWQVIAADEAGGWAPESPTGWLIHDDLSARLHPRRACAALAAAIRARGGAIRSEGQPRGAVVDATGAAGLAALTAAMGREMGRGIKGQAVLLALDRRAAPQIYADGLHVVPHADGSTSIGSTTERDYADPVTTDAQLDAVISRARAAVPALGDAPVIERWAGLRPRSRSRAPVLGAHPLRPGAFIANGGFKIGFGVAPMVGEAMADLVLEGCGDAIPEGFRPEAAL